MANTTPLLDSVSEPDLMNDPLFDANPRRKQKNLEDADTCRICRGEGSKEEPLFYPCKCSGSIKFVHQNCLMEWLSHSQKKHCELCKTPFRFTKLYHPHMPNSVPLPVFLRQAAVHSWKTFLAWSRLHLVVFVWVAWLPWCMRSVWRGLFWIADGGWINWEKTEERALLVAQQQLDKLAAEGTSPASNQLLMSQESTASALLSQMAKSLPRFLTPVSQTLNLSNAESPALKLARRLLMGFISRQSNGSSSSLTTAIINTTHVSDNSSSSPSWLSNVRILGPLSSSPTVHNLITDTMEGQLITLLVVVVFILLFLIREWVVQQQPGMNVGAVPNADAGVAQVGDVPIREQAARQRAEQVLRQAHAAEVVAEGGDQGDQAEERGGREVLAMIAPARRRRQRANTETDNDDDSGADLIPEYVGPRNMEPHMQSRSRRTSFAGSSASPQRPKMPNRDKLAQAAEIRRTLEEQSRASGQRDWPGLNVFIDLWNRAESKPSEVLRIIEEEGRGDELAWIVATMNRLENTSTVHDDDIITSPATESGSGVGDHSDLAEYGINAHFQSTTPGQDDGTRLDFGSKSASSSNENHIEANIEKGLNASSSLTTVNKERPIQASSTRENIDFLLGYNNHGLEPGTSENQDSGQTSDSWPEIRNNDPFNPEYSSNEPQGSHGSQITSGAANAPELAIDLPGPNENPDDARDENDENDEQENEILLPERPETLAANHGLADTIMNWLWGGLNPVVRPQEDHADLQDDEHIVENLADEAPFVRVDHAQPVVENVGNNEHPAQDPEVVAAAVQAGIDPNGAEAVDDGEDLEGIMELVGMQGPLAGLIQNGMFCAILVSLTIFLGMWVPYIAGKLFLVFLANPVSLLFKLPLRWASISADLIIDLCVFGAGCAFFWVDTVIRFFCAPVGWVIPPLGTISQNKILAETAKTYAEDAMERLAKIFVITGDSLSESDIPTFSIIAHESLRIIENRFSLSTQVLRDSFTALLTLISTDTFSFSGTYQSVMKYLIEAIKRSSEQVMTSGFEYLALTPSLFKINPLRVSLNIPQRTTPLDFSLAYWDTKDRILAIFSGYIFFAVIGLLYLRLSASVRGRNGNGKVDGAFADMLYQAGGVMKVILIISIEMIAFPLYCGLLLDVALLPLFGNVTVMSRLSFLMASPNTSLFVHWFIGTCYMFHFALFVSMCRRIMRSGVLCESIEPRFI